MTARTIALGATVMVRYPGLVEREERYRWRCETCGHAGWGEPLVPDPWALTHARGHLDCPECGKPTPVAEDGSAQWHTRCAGPERTSS